ncbi:alpha/beta fold hydrolase [Oleiagrimonas soli]|nr:alpha/beta hydrolase [Oleiagrimonas soli]KGI78535.1 peroxidase [Oleiagrimonas soli]
MVDFGSPREQTLDTHFDSADGVRLAGEIRNPQGAPCVLFAHGFGQTRHAWSATADALAATGCRCVGFDARGHGLSGRPDDGYHMQQFFDDLRTVADAQPQKPILVGASMGGLLGLAVAGESETPPFSALVLVDITPRWETSGVERILDFMRAWPDGFGDYDEAAQAIAAYLPHRRGRKSAAQLQPLLRRGEDGRLRWHWDPRMLAPIAEEGERHQPRLIEATRRVKLPVLLLSGGRSDVVSPQTIDEFLELVPHARHIELPRATHMVAGDANDAFTRAIADFIGLGAETMQPMNGRPSGTA